MGKVLVAVDTDHIKRYVFGTDRLKEIRGASSQLDQLNRVEMRRDVFHSVLSDDFETIFANGGSGLFLVDEKQVLTFCQKIQATYRDQTARGATVTVASHPIPPEAGQTNAEIRRYNLKNELDLLRYKLARAKSIPPSTLSLPGHAFMRICASCGVEYAREEAFEQDEDNRTVGRNLICEVCLGKRKRNLEVKGFLKTWTNPKEAVRKREDQQEKLSADPLWALLLEALETRQYFEAWRARNSGEGLERPEDFDALGVLNGNKQYMGLIYADGNGMGKARELLRTLNEQKHFASIVDESLRAALADALKAHLPLSSTTTNFAFDVLLLGGDDLIIAVPALHAMDMALTIANSFEKLTQERLQQTDLLRGQTEYKNGFKLSTAVILAPTKYPFRLLLDLAESTLKSTKSSNPENQSLINFVVVNGGTAGAFEEMQKGLRSVVEEEGIQKKFYATQRPYDLPGLTDLLHVIRGGHQRHLGRTKLHQLREVVFKQNLTTSVGEALQIIRNWREEQRRYILGYFYRLSRQNQEAVAGADSLFQPVIFPWYAATPRKADSSEETKAKQVEVYRTTVLDFAELYDFVKVEGGAEDE